MLEGPYNETSSLMNDNLRTLPDFATSEPYTALGFTSVNSLGGEVIIDLVNALAVSGNDAIIDWIFVELRSGGDPNIVLATSPALLQADGDVVDMDGTSPLMFTNLSAGDYSLAIRHRNHLSIRTQSTATLTAFTSLSIDFTSAATPVTGTDARKDVNGTLVLWAGDANNDNSINAADRSETWNNRNLSGYHVFDVNLDGSCNAGDRSIAWNNRNRMGE